MLLSAAACGSHCPQSPGQVAPEPLQEPQALLSSMQEIVSNNKRNPGSWSPGPALSWAPQLQMQVLNIRKASVGSLQLHVLDGAVGPGDTKKDNGQGYKGQAVVRWEGGSPAGGRRSWDTGVKGEDAWALWSTASDGSCGWRSAVQARLEAGGRVGRRGPSPEAAEEKGKGGRAGVWRWKH